MVSHVMQKSTSKTIESEHEIRASVTISILEISTFEDVFGLNVQHNQCIMSLPITRLNIKTICNVGLAFEKRFFKACRKTIEVIIGCCRFKNARDPMLVLLYVV